MHATRQRNIIIMVVTTGFTLCRVCDAGPRKADMEEKAKAMYLIRDDKATLAESLGAAMMLFIWNFR